MSLGLRLDLKQSQQLVMTPQLQQAIKLLQMTNIEVAGYVDQELTENPFLDAPADGSDNVGDGVEASLGGDDAPLETDQDTGWDQPAEPPASDWLCHVGSGQGGGTFDDDLPDLQERLARAPTLHDHLLEQLHVEVTNLKARVIGMHLVEAIDDAGYLRTSVADVAERLDVPVADVEAVLAVIQHFDPTGVGARDLAECLALQLHERDRLDPAMAKLLRHLDRLAKADRRGLMRLCGVDDEDLALMVQEIRALDPRPGLAFAPPAESGAVPDLWVLPNRGGWRVELNNATLPRVLVNVDYYTQVHGPGMDPSVKAYFAERFQTANWLVKALDQRARTILKVAEFIVEEQSGFLKDGIGALKPLVLRQVAEGTGLHESTVSRATAGKLVATPQGVMPFKAFFSNAVGGESGGEAHAAEAIRQQIKGLVERETVQTVLSDDQIVRELKGLGMVLARRTVAKYREGLGIPSSVERRRVLAMSA